MNKMVQNSCNINFKVNSTRKGFPSRAGITKTESIFEYNYPFY